MRRKRLIIGDRIVVVVAGQLVVVVVETRRVGVGFDV